MYEVLHGNSCLPIFTSLGRAEGDSAEAGTKVERDDVREKRRIGAGKQGKERPAQTSGLGLLNPKCRERTEWLRFPLTLTNCVQGHECTCTCASMHVLHTHTLNK